MLQIRTTSGEQFDLMPETRISLQLISPIYEAEVIRGSFSYPFEFPLTPTNRRLLNFPEIIENRADFNTSVDVEILFSGDSIMPGVMKVSNAGAKYVAQVLTGVGAKADLLKNTKLTALDLGGERQLHTYYPEINWNVPVGMAGQTAFRAEVWDFSVSPSATNYVVPYNVTTAQTLTDLADAINADVNATATAYPSATALRLVSKRLADTFFNAQVSYDTSGGNTVFTLGFSNYDRGYTDVINFMNDAISAGYPDKEMAFFVLKNTDFYGEKNTDFSGYVNYYWDDSFTLLNGATTFNLTAFPYLHYVLKRIAVLLDYEIKGSAYFDAELSTLVIYNNFGFEANGLNQVINLINNVPDITAAELIKAYRLAFCLGIFPDHKKKTIEFIPLKDLLNSAEEVDFTDIAEPRFNVEKDDSDGFHLKDSYDDADLTALENIKSLEGFTIADPVATTSTLPAEHEINILRLVEDVNQYYVTKTNPLGQNLVWEYYSDNLFDFEVGNSEQEIVSGLSTLLMKKEEDVTVMYDPHTWIIPHTRQPSSSLEYELGYNDFSLRLLFFRGLQEEVNGNLYPLASSDVYDVNGDVIADYSLRWDGDYGRYNVWYKDWLNFLQRTKKVSATLRMDLSHIKNLDWKKKHRIGNNLYFIGKISVTLSMKGISKAQAELYRV